MSILSEYIGLSMLTFFSMLTLIVMALLYIFGVPLNPKFYFYPLVMLTHSATWWFVILEAKIKI